MYEVEKAEYEGCKAYIRMTPADDNPLRRMKKHLEETGSTVQIDWNWGVNMKQKIDPSEIKPGDVIRWVRESRPGAAHEVVYTASNTVRVWSNDEGVHYLLERPEPPFEPYWGMVIGKPGDNTKLAVYLPMGGATQIGWLCSVGDKWIGNEEAKQKLAEGWVIIEKPEGVK